MVALEKNTALSVPLEAYGCVFIIATTYPKASVVACWRGKKYSVAFLSVASYFAYLLKT